MSGLGHYLFSFIAYTLLAVGFIYGMFLYLKQNPRLLSILARRPLSNGSSTTSLRVETMLPLEARKSLYVICAGEERFLIATSTEGTQFLSKLQEPANLPETVINQSEPKRIPVSSSAIPANVISSHVLSESEESELMRAKRSLVSRAQGVQGILRTLRFVFVKVRPIVRERFARLQYQFEKTSSLHW